MKELINNIKEEISKIKELVDDDPDLALITVISLLSIATTLAIASYENNRIEIALEQKDNPAMLLEMCGNDLSGCDVEYLSRCIDFIYARDFSYCAGGYEKLPLYIPKSEQ